MSLDQIPHQDLDLAFTTQLCLLGRQSHVHPFLFFSEEIQVVPKR